MKRMIAIKLVVLLALSVLPSLSSADEALTGRIQQRLTEQVDRKFDQMTQVLDLSPEQQVLLEEMKESNKSYFAMKMESKRELTRIFRQEMGKENPDFASASEGIKSRHLREEEIGFGAMVDAMAAFYEELTPEQQAKLSRMKKEGLHRGRQRLEGGGRGEF